MMKSIERLLCAVHCQAGWQSSHTSKLGAACFWHMPVACTCMLVRALHPTVHVSQQPYASGDIRPPHNSALRKADGSEHCFARLTVAPAPHNESPITFSLAGVSSDALSPRQVIRLSLVPPVQQQTPGTMHVCSTGPATARSIQST